MTTVSTDKQASMQIINGKKLSNKLFTHEDPIHLHKTLGILSLISFCYRYGYVWATKGNLGFDGSLFDWMTMFVHMALSTSSLIFRVINRRILSRPMIIWNEYRLHAIIFSLRCVSVFICGMLIPQDLPYIHLIQYALVMTHHLVVDEITRRYGVPEETTVRAKDNSRPLTKAILRGYSFYQFLALGSHLSPSVRMGDMGFNTLIAIQSSAFLMTLYRKNIIRGRSHGYWYTGCLVVSAFHIFKTFSGFQFGAKILFAFCLRIFLHMNKYVIWSLFSLSSSPMIQEYMMTKDTYGILSTIAMMVQRIESIPYLGVSSGAILCLSVYYHVITVAWKNQLEWNRLNPKGHATKTTRAPIEINKDPTLTSKAVIEDLADKTADNTPDVSPVKKKLAHDDNLFKQKQQ